MPFMRPEIVAGYDLIALDIPPEDMGISPMPDKWYGRLSAPGYLDSTEWAEFDSWEEALVGVCRAFGLCPACYEEEEEDCKCARGQLKRACKRQLARLRKLARETDDDDN